PDQVRHVVVRQGVVDVGPLPAADDQPGLAEDPQPLRDGGELLPHRLDQLGDAPLALGQQLQQPQSRLVSHRPEQLRPPAQGGRPALTSSPPSWCSSCRTAPGRCSRPRGRATGTPASASAAGSSARAASTSSGTPATTARTACGCSATRPRPTASAGPATRAT